MSAETTDNLAFKIARLLQEETSPQPVDLYSLQKSIEKISERLEKIETALTSQNPNNHHSSFSDFRPSKLHPSQDKFDVAEIIAGEAIENSEEKPCPYEPTGKPCDHCSMCNSRGF